MISKKSIHIFIRLSIILLKDVFSGTFFRFAKNKKNELNFEYSIAITQEIKPSDTFDNKVFNLKYASLKINEFIIFPNEIFSFWNIIGNPALCYKTGRSIVNGKLKEEVGGGLCQVSGIIYHISILAGLEIIERHNHSVDIYSEETRFTPLGTDATVAYGFKDLRIRNSFNFPVKYQMEVKINQINISLLSTEKIKENSLIFSISKHEKQTIVNVTNSNNLFVNRSVYKKI